MISFALDEEQTLLRDTARKFAQEVLRPAGRLFEETLGIPEATQRAFDALSLHDLDLYDPVPGSVVTAALVHEELAAGDPAAAIALWSPHTAGHALWEMASREQRDRLLPILQRGGRGAVAYSERWKCRPAGFTTSATPVKDGYLLSGIKSYVINAGAADLTLVFAQVNPDTGWDGFGVFAVEGRSGEEKSFRPGDRHELLGLQAVRAEELILEEHFVREENRLRGGGDLLLAAQRFFARCWLVGAARQVGLCRAAYEYALGYTQDRHAFGKPVAHFQAVAFTLAELLMDLESSRWLLWRAAAAADGGTFDMRLCAQAAEHAGEAAFRAADACVQLLGGAGFIKDYPAEKWLREVKALQLVSGCAQVYQQVIAAEELGHALDGDLQKAPRGAGLPIRHGLPGSLVGPILT